MSEKSQAPDDTPSLIGRYEITATLGFGAMGAVYKAFDPIIKRELAIKTIRLDVPPQSPQRASFIERFYQEARISGTLSHPNIVTLFDIGEERGVPFLAMEYVEGPTLSELLDEGVRFEPERVFTLVSQIAAGLDYAHSRGVIHRDIKPSNLIVQQGDKVKVADFGIAKLLDTEITQTGALLGTPAYMSPEQAMGEPLDGRSDIFSLGVCAFEMLSGEQPFPGNNVTAVLYRLVHVDPIEPADLEMRGVVPHRWREVFHRVLAKKPDGRYEKASHFVRGLEECLGSLSAGVSEETIALATPAETTVTLETPRPEALQGGEPSPGPAAEETLVVQSAMDVQETGPDDSATIRMDASGASPEDSDTVALPLSGGGGGAGQDPGPTVIMNAAQDPTAPTPTTETLPPPPAEGAASPPGLARPLPATWLLGGAAVVFVLAASVVVWLLWSRGGAVESGPVVPSATPVAELPELPTVGTLLVESEPSGAEVSVDGEARGTTPLELGELPFGEHEVKLTLKGYAAESHDVLFSAESPTAELQATLSKRRATTGTANFASMPAGATVFVDGKRAGTTPLNGLRLQPGEHDVSLILEGHERWSGSVRVVAGRRARVQTELVAELATPPPPEPVDTAKTYENRDGDVDRIARKRSGASPSYPTDRVPRLKSGERVSVTLSFLVTAEGGVEDVKVMESAGQIIDDVVTSAVRAWTYVPATIRGTPVKVQIRFRQTFLGG